MENLGDEIFAAFLLIVGIVLFSRAIRNIKFTKKSFFDYSRTFGLSITAIVTALVLIVKSFYG